MFFLGEKAEEEENRNENQSMLLYIIIIEPVSRSKIINPKIDPIERYFQQIYY